MTIVEGSDDMLSFVSRQMALPRLRPDLRRARAMMAGQPRRGVHEALVRAAHAANRFVDVVAMTTPDDAHLAPLRVHALYRLGCYSAVVSDMTPALEAQARTRPVLAQALATSLAACGQGRAARRVLAAVEAGGTARDIDRHRMARALAPFDPALAMDLMLTRAQATGLSIALAEVSGDALRARTLLDKALAAGRDRQEPDIHLLAANLAGDVDARRAGLARHLAAFGLSAPVDLPGAPPSPLRLTGDARAAPPRSVRGPLVTVIMPAYRTASRIGAAIASLQAQTWADLEILVVDDASGDETPAVVAAMAEADPRIRLIALSENGGPYVARNVALEAARGAFITCHDSDDWAHPERIERQMQPLLRNRRYVFSTSNWVRADDAGAFFARPVYPLSRLNPASVLFRRVPVMARAGWWDIQRSGADTEFFNRLLVLFGAGARATVRQTLTVGAHRPGSLMTAPETGLHRGPMTRSRLDYWETWRARHVAMRRERLRWLLGRLDPGAFA